MPSKLRCSTCGKQGRGLCVHHGKVFCGKCLAADEDDEMCVKVKILAIRVETTCDEARRVRKKGKGK